jgi:hypothetical protein
MQKNKSFLGLDPQAVLITVTASKVETPAAVTILFSFQFYRGASCMLKVKQEVFLCLQKLELLSADHPSSRRIPVVVSSLPILHL